MKKVTIKDLKALEAFAKKFAATLKGGETIGLVGELGAGKTAFVQALAKAFGIPGAVRSPTFTILQVFKTGKAEQKKGVLWLAHIDAYRAVDEAEIYRCGFDDYAGRTDAVCVVEWADRMPSIHARKKYQEITIEIGDAGERILTVEKH
jgi:tRNA threonylcarbamoyladenosine biosynthesis protein TsaE